MKIQEIKRKCGSNVYFIVIPKEICEDFFIKKGDELRFRTNKNQIIMEKK
jgi:bifunctional DNA-binding transcriptional regulator/antitoxin component of YhaV-PrlF toxin-antitoxin module